MKKIIIVLVRCVCVRERQCVYVCVCACERVEYVWKHVYYACMCGTLNCVYTKEGEKCRYT